MKDNIKEKSNCRIACKQLSEILGNGKKEISEKSNWLNYWREKSVDSRPSFICLIYQFISEYFKSSYHFSVWKKWRNLFCYFAFFILATKTWIFGQYTKEHNLWFDIKWLTSFQPLKKSKNEYLTTTFSKQLQNQINRFCY